MTELRQITDLSNLPGPVALAIGMFDGVHLGHQEVIRGALDFAGKHGGSAVVVTFDPHPLQFLTPESAPRLLCSTKHKLRLLESLGVQHALVLPFGQVMAKTSALDFVAGLVSACRPLGLVSVGYSWSFGAGREGNIHQLMDCGEQHSFGVYGVPEVRAGGGIVSSTRIREAVRQGDFANAALLLGRRYTVLGSVVKGREFGRQLGFPTANLALENEELPPSGVYAVRAQLQGQPSMIQGVANLGLRPTVETSATNRTLEVHFLNFSGDIYGSEVEIEFAGFIRPEQKFADLEALKAQISRDVIAAGIVFRDRPVSE